ncbi:MAG: type II CRISPR RNA-guided endonuclease Cas9 [Fidelibacterota bacterium]
MGTVLGLDIGPNSIGWTLIFPEGNEIIATGVRVFPEGVENYGKGGQQGSKNVTRRIARGMRRRNQRFKMRRDHLVKQLKELGMYPREKKKQNDFFLIDPYEARTNGLYRKVALLEFGRALYHINEHRGFKSNRKTGDSENSKIYEGKDGLTGITETEQAIQDGNYKTLGEYLFHLNPQEQRRRARYTKREMYENEFCLLLEKQKQYYPDVLNEQTKENLSQTIFSQRKLKSQKGTVAKCTFEPKKRCAPKSSPTFQYFRILEQVSRLRVTRGNGEEDFLSPEGRDLLINKLNTRDKMTFKQVAKILGIDGYVKFNLEHEGFLRGNRTSHSLAKVFGKKNWQNFTPEEQYAIWHTLHFSDDPDWLRDYAKNKWHLDEKAVKNLLKVSLEPGYCRLSHKAMLRIIPHLLKSLTKDGVTMTYDKAVEAAGYEFTKVHDQSGKMSKLPPPKDIRNPIVQQALYETRKLVNAIVEEYGNPDCIKVELVRELKLPRKRRERIFYENQRRRAENERIRRILKEDVGIPEPTNDDILKYKLWEECDKICPYSGKKINSVAQLFNGEFEIEHILPLSRSLDDSYMNKTLCHHTKNVEKGNQTPWETWGDSGEYEKILTRAKKLPYPKYRRFLQKELKEDEFVHRHLNDTAYIAREVRNYLTYICTDVRTVPGTATARLRRFWGLNSILSKNIDIKNREDHRHHAVDALVVANTERKYIQHLSTFYHYNREARSEHFPLPWDSFRADAATAVNQILVSHKVKNAVKGKLHKDSYYGLIRDDHGQPQLDSKGQKIYGLRKAVTTLKETEVRKIPDRAIQDAIMAWSNQPKETRPDFPRLPSGRAIKRVRIHDVHTNVIELKKGVFVEPGSNHHIVIFENIKTGKRVGAVVSLFEATQRQKNGSPIIDKTPPDEKHRFLLSLSINEMVLLGEEFEAMDTNHLPPLEELSSKLYRVQIIPASQQISFRLHTVSILVNDEGIKPGLVTKYPNSFRGIKVSIDHLGHLHRRYD